MAPLTHVSRCWLADFAYVREHRFVSVEATVDAENAWVEHVNELAGSTLFPLANSWYVGANIPGKPRVFMPYIGGVGVYRQKCADVATNGYEGFAFLPGAGASSSVLARQVMSVRRV